MGRPPKPVRAISSEEAERDLVALQARRLAVLEELSRAHDPTERQALLDFLGAYHANLKRVEKQRSDAIGREYVAKLKAEKKK